MAETSKRKVRDYDTIKSEANAEADKIDEATKRYKQLDVELKDHPRSIENKLKHLKHYLPAPKLIEELVHTDRLTKFRTEYEDRVDYESVGAGCCEISMDRWTGYVTLDGKELVLKATCWTGGDWDTDFSVDTCELDEPKDPDQFWKRVLDTYDGDIAMALGVILYLNECVY